MEMVMLMPAKGVEAKDVSRHKKVLWAPTLHIDSLSSHSTQMCTVFDAMASQDDQKPTSSFKLLFPKMRSISRSGYSVSVGSDTQGGLIGVDEDDMALRKEGGEGEAHVPASTSKCRSQGMTFTWRYFLLEESGWD